MKTRGKLLRWKYIRYHLHEDDIHFCRKFVSPSVITDGDKNVRKKILWQHFATNCKQVVIKPKRKKQVKTMITAYCIYFLQRWAWRYKYFYAISKRQFSWIPITGHNSKGFGRRVWPNVIHDPCDASITLVLSGFLDMLAGCTVKHTVSRWDGHKQNITCDINNETKYYPMEMALIFLSNLKYQARRVIVSNAMP